MIISIIILVRPEKGDDQPVGQVGEWAMAIKFTNKEAPVRRHLLGGAR